MFKKPIVRIAYVRFSPNGKSYPTKCERKDILVGSEVEVLMSADKQPQYMFGVVTSISHQRWNLSCHVSNLECEIEYIINSNGQFERVVDLTKKPTPHQSNLNIKKIQYSQLLPQSSSREMQNIYEAVSTEEGEFAYLGDGVWINSDEKFEDDGR